MIVVTMVGAEPARTALTYPMQDMGLCKTWRDLINGKPDHLELAFCINAKRK